MKIGILGYEYFGIKFGGKSWKPTSAHGGFGFLTKQKAEYLVNMGHEVHVFIPASSYDRTHNANVDLDINGVKLHLYKAMDKLSEKRLKRIVAQFSQHWLRNKHLDRALAKFPVDIYQSEEPGLFSKQSLKFSRNHLIIFQNPFDEEDFKIMAKAYNDYLDLDKQQTRSTSKKSSRLSRYFAKRSRDYVREMLKEFDPAMVYAAANFISEKVKKMYILNYLPGHLPNPMDILEGDIEKSKTPSVVWIGRWDPQKRPDIALKVAASMPDVNFYFIGKATEHEVYLKKEIYLKDQYKSFSNIHFEEFISEERKGELLKQAWILLNTSVREGLPVTFLEAMVRKTCIVSEVDPDGYATRFGVAVREGKYAEAIRMAINGGLYMEKGKLGFEHAVAVHEISSVMNKHVEIYGKIIELNSHRTR